jgi:hypothetical protein
MMRILSLLVLLLISFCSNAQVNNIVWQKTIGCSGTEVPNDLSLDAFGNYYLAGFYDEQCSFTDTAYGFMDGWIIKLDNAGNKVWSKGFGGSGLETFIKLLPASNGDILALGYCASSFGNIVNKGDWDFLVVKLDTAGNLLWQKNYGGSGADVPEDVIETSNGDFIAVGYTTSKDGDITDTIGGITDAWALRIDNTGNILSSKTYGSSNRDYFERIVKSTNNNYLILGESDGNDFDVLSNKGGVDLWLLSINDTGAVHWSKSYGGTNGEGAGSITACNQHGGYIYSCYSQSNDFDFNQSYGGADAWLVKIDTTGNIEWKKHYGGSGGEDATIVIESKEGGYMLFTGTSSYDFDAIGNHGYSDMLGIKVDDTGKVIWKKAYGCNDPDGFSAVSQLNDSSYLFCGFTTSATGDVLAAYGMDDAWLVKVSKDSIYVPDGVITPVLIHPGIQVYPTITDNEVTIERPYGKGKALVTLLNDRSQVIMEQQIFPEERIRKIYLESLPAGMYFLKVTSPNMVHTFKIFHK